MIENIASFHARLDQVAVQTPDQIAVEELDGTTISYGELAQLSDRVRDRVVAMGVRPGDRVGIALHKSIDAVAAIYGVLKAGGAYVPIDPGGPPNRNVFIISHCNLRAVISERRTVRALALDSLAADGTFDFLQLEAVGGGRPLRDAIDLADQVSPAKTTETDKPSPDQLAYILYTSGSTGEPKGVMLSHTNATAFVDWGLETFNPTGADRFSSHAPFHFDLSILDLFLPVRCGACLVLIPEDIGKAPVALAAFLESKKISIWYSTPTILNLLVEYGDLGNRDLSSLRLVLFAGEVFQINQLRKLISQIPCKHYANLYGPTETNVCSWYAFDRSILDGPTEPLPIGRICPHLDHVVIDSEDNLVATGTEGELCVRGPNVTAGYWNRPDLQQRSFLSLPEASATTGRPYYRTGDLVIEELDGNLRFVGRRDRMVKKRGFRIELGEIEAAITGHPDVLEAAAIASDSRDGIRITVHCATRTGDRISSIALKHFCVDNLPAYMVPDLFKFHKQLPKTSTDKTDFQALSRMMT